MTVIVTLAVSVVVILVAYAAASFLTVDEAGDGESFLSRWFAPSFTISIDNDTHRSLTWNCETGGFAGLAPGKTATLRFLDHNDDGVAEGCSTRGDAYGQTLCVEEFLSDLHPGERFTATEFAAKFACQ